MGTLAEIAIAPRKNRIGCVLVISHDAVFAMDIAEMLEEHGIETECLSEIGEGTVEAIRQSRFMSALVDMDFYRHGSPLCDQSKPVSDMPFILLGRGAEDARFHDFASDVRWVSKPVVVDHLLPMLAPGRARTQLRAS